ncbi:DUF1850 domain-containing protein [Thalassobacillus sp. CUG 92003]|uniref:DUF1850 domain-containing protein n=1 Tax=Thalassobacillus sp. CUG 92003 TaxID=2736641 RepID=UPI0015E66826|nr:DUF1850 domain-containing protein [Thalassobacillus sp. CUG 92003]
MNIVRKWKLAIILVLFLFLAGALVLFYPFRYVLAIHYVKTDDLGAYLPVSEEDHFQLKFTHSVHLSDVVEEYEMKRTQLYPIQLIYEDTAIGMPSNAAEGETFTERDGKYYITNLNGVHDKLSLVVGEVRADHTIIYKGQSYLLKEYVGAGSWVNIKPLRMSNWELLRGEKLHE